jgi:hypothetical protein
MSDVPKITCTICDPSTGDINRIRRPITVTSQEIVNLVQHFITTHTGLLAIEQKSEALDKAFNAVREMEMALGRNIEVVQGDVSRAQRTADEALKLAQKATESAEAADEAADELNENA